MPGIGASLENDVLPKADSGNKKEERRTPMGDASLFFMRQPVLEEGTPFSDA